MTNQQERVAVVAGVRTPFVKAGAQFKAFGFQELGVHVVRALLKRAQCDPASVEQLVFSTVLLDPRTPNWAREIVFQAGLPSSVYAESVSNNCISGLVAITVLAEHIASGRVRVGVAGGSESMSNPSLLYNPCGARKFLELSRARGLAEKLRCVCSLCRPGYALPMAPKIAEPSTGLSMGQHMEITAQEMNIPRKEQDEVALASHMRAAQASKDGRLAAQIEPFAGVEKDLMVRADTSLEKLAKLPPVFDRSTKGTLTAGNSSALTDGASAILLMSESRAKADGREVLAFIKDYEYAAIDPKDGLLMAPGVAVPRLLGRLNLRLENFDRIEMHEAFGAQMIANIRAWENGWHGELPCGHVDRARLNVAGGSLAIGHPFAATGGRLLMSLASELKRSRGKLGLLSVCAAGAMACALVLEGE